MTLGRRPRGQPASRRVRGASRRTAEPGRDLAPSVRGAPSAPGVLSRGEGGMGAPLQLPDLTPFTSARAFSPSGRPAKQSGPAKCCSRSLAWLPSLELRLFPLYLPQGACVHVHCVCTCVCVCVCVGRLVPEKAEGKDPAYQPCCSPAVPSRAVIFFCLFFCHFLGRSCGTWRFPG